MDHMDGVNGRGRPQTRKQKIFDSRHNVLDGLLTPLALEVMVVVDAEVEGPLEDMERGPMVVLVDGLVEGADKFQDNNAGTNMESFCSLLTERIICRTVESQQCKAVPRRQCRTVSKQSCSSVPRQECRNVPKQQCRLCLLVTKIALIEIYRNVPTQKCSAVPKQQCREQCNPIAWCKVCS